MPFSGIHACLHTVQVEAGKKGGAISAQASLEERHVSVIYPACTVSYPLLNDASVHDAVCGEVGQPPAQLPAAKRHFISQFRPLQLREC